MYIQQVHFQHVKFNCKLGQCVEFKNQRQGVCDVDIAIMGAFSRQNWQTSIAINHLKVQVWEGAM